MLKLFDLSAGVFLTEVFQRSKPVSITWMIFQYPHSLSNVGSWSLLRFSFSLWGTELLTNSHPGEVNLQLLESNWSKQRTTLWSLLFAPHSRPAETLTSERESSPKLKLFLLCISFLSASTTLFLSADFSTRSFSRKVSLRTAVNPQRRKILSLSFIIVVISLSYRNFKAGVKTRREPGLRLLLSGFLSQKQDLKLHYETIPDMFSVFQCDLCPNILKLQLHMNKRHLVRVKVT